MTDHPTCATCLWWDELDPDGEGQHADGGYLVTDRGTGRCRLNPPARAVTVFHESSDAANGAAWPVTWDEDWCGQHSDLHRTLKEKSAAVSSATLERYTSMVGPPSQKGEK